MIQTKTLKEALKDPGVIEVVEGLIGIATYNKNGLQKANTALGHTSMAGKYKIGTVNKGLVSCTFIISINNAYSTTCGTYLLQLISPPSGKNEVKLLHKKIISSNDAISFYARFYNEQIELYIESMANFCMTLLLKSRDAMEFTYDIKKLELIPEDCISSEEVL